MKDIPAPMISCTLSFLSLIVAMPVYKNSNTRINTEWVMPSLSLMYTRSLLVASSILNAIGFLRTGNPRAVGRELTQTDFE